MGIVVSGYLANPKTKVVTVILINNNNYNIWVRQCLLVAKLYNVEYHPWEYKTILDQERNDIKIEFQAYPPAEIRGLIKQVKAESDDSDKDH